MLKHPLLAAVVAWARAEARIRAVIITGSLARADGGTDAFSDLDAQIITDDSQRYTRDDSWLDSLGEVWIRFPLEAALPYRLVWFAGGIKVDFQFVHPDSIRAQTASGRLSEEYQRGYVVALDKDGLTRALPPSPRIFPAPAPPSAAEIHATINEFWFEAIHVAQFIVRRQFWVVKWRDWTMKEMLLRLLEWHARATRGAGCNTWLLGKNIEQWADAPTQAAIQEIWAGWDAGALWQSLRRQLTLFARLSRELLAARGFYNPQARVQHDIENYIAQLQAADEGGKFTKR